MGSGQYTNLHLLQVNGYSHQAPITFYTQKQEDMAPGMESGGFNSRFVGSLSQNVTCHNGTAGNSGLLINTGIPFGIDCERCHAPAAFM